MRKLLLTVAASAAAIVAATPVSALTLYGLTREAQGNRLEVFDDQSPNSYFSDTAISGAGFGPGTQNSLYAIDFRTVDGKLYALGRVDRLYGLYTIDTVTAVATQVAQLTDSSGGAFNLDVENVGFDYNPTSDSFTVFTAGDARYMVQLSGVTNQVSIAGDNSVDYNTNEGVPVPSVVGAAYNQNGVLYTLDSIGNILATANGVTLSKISILSGVTGNPPGGNKLGENVGFDIWWDGAGNEIALFNRGINGGQECANPGSIGTIDCHADGALGFDELYEINLATGAVKLHGNAAGPNPGRLDRNLTALTAAPGAIPEPATWALMVAGFGLVGFQLRRRSTAKTVLA